MADSWPSATGPVVKKHLKKLAAATIADKDMYENSSNPAVAQLWLALASLSARLEKLEKKLDSLEKDGLLEAIKSW